MWVTRRLPFKSSWDASQKPRRRGSRKNCSCWVQKVGDFGRRPGLGLTDWWQSPRSMVSLQPEAPPMWRKGTCLQGACATMLKPARHDESSRQDERMDCPAFHESPLSNWRDLDISMPYASTTALPAVQHLGIPARRTLEARLRGGHAQLQDVGHAHEPGKFAR